MRRNAGTQLLTATALIRHGKVPSAAIDPTIRDRTAIHVDLEERRAAMIAKMLDAELKPKAEMFRCERSITCSRPANWRSRTGARSFAVIRCRP